jgi:hypothetical protein
MNAARTDASQTMTVAANQVPMPLMESPSVTIVVPIRETSVAISATLRLPARAPGRRAAR